MTLNPAQVLEEFRSAGALLEGHFLLSSGLHSPIYLQCARVLMDPARAERLVAGLAAQLRDTPVDLVVAPAMGGILVGYELARQLGRPNLFTERVDGRFELRRGFAIAAGARCVIAEDVVTTGLSTRECIACVEQHGGRVVAAVCLVDRSGGRAALPVPLKSLLELDLPTYRADELPEALRAMPAVKPGSRPRPG